MCFSVLVFYTYCNLSFSFFPVLQRPTAIATWTKVGHHSMLSGNRQDILCPVLQFRVAHNTFSLFVPEVCAAIVKEYQAEVLDAPTT